MPKTDENVLKSIETACPSTLYVLWSKLPSADHAVEVYIKTLKLLP